VVIAEAGQGKTYHSHYLAAKMLEDWRTQGHRLPIDIDSRQWAQLSREDPASLSIAKTILHSFRYFRAPLAWVEDHEEEFLRTALRLDLFTLIFDGLDEYVLWSGRGSAAETVGGLVEMARATTARIIVTSRTTFWMSEVAAVAPEVERHGTFMFRLRAFDASHASNYFEQRLKGPALDRARNVFRELHKRDATMAGRGFVLHLVADLFTKDLAATEPQ